MVSWFIAPGYQYQVSLYEQNREVKIIDDSIEYQIMYARKKAIEESDGDVDKYFTAFDYHCKYITKHIYERTVTLESKGGNL
ncbi:MAG: hypothetical protein PHW97_10805 [Fermentimonas sp.]|nr:hypothetical protein [Fermentimonas sp.]